jgi:MFS transporter, DHA3 family, macrolide efflux protein
LSRRAGAVAAFVPLRERHFRALFVAHLMSNLGDWLAFLALFGLVAVQWRAGAMRISLLATAYVLPLVCVAPIAGVFVDRWDLRRVLLASDLARAAILVAMAYQANFGVLCALLFLQQAIGCFFNPAQSAALPRLVPRTELLAANALTNSAAQVSKLLGPGVAGLLVAACGPRGCFLADAASFALSAAWLATLPSLPAGRGGARSAAEPASTPAEPAHASVPETTRTTAASVRGVWEEMRAGWKFVRRTPSVHRVALLLTVTMIALGAFIAVVGVHARDVLGLQARGMGLLLSTLGAGAVMGALLVTHLPASAGRLRTIAAGMLLGGVALALVAWSHDRQVAFAGVLVIGVATAATLVPGHTLVQETTPHALLGRVMSSIVAVIGLAQAASMALAGSVATHAGTRAVLAASALVLGGAALFSLGWSMLARRRRPAGATAA